MASGARRAVFLDRDGVLCEDRPDYVKSWSEWRWIPGAREGAAALARGGWTLIVVTNQAGIGRGVVERGAVDDIHRRMAKDLAAAGAPLAATYYCPHAPEARCECRKPRPGMLEIAAREHALDLGASVFVGDALRDHQAANAAGTRFILVLTGQGPQTLQEANLRNVKLVTASDLPEAASLILGA